MNNNSATSRSIRALDDYIEGRLAIAKRDAETTYEEYPKMSSQEIEEGVKNQTLTMNGNVNGSMKADASMVGQNRHFRFNWKSTQNHNEPTWQDAKDAIITDSNNLSVIIASLASCHVGSL